MKISIFGLGYVGAVSLGCLVRDGHTVYGVDVDEGKLNLIREGKTPIIEEGMIELMSDVSKSGLLHVTNTAKEAIGNTEVSFVCVGTPSSANGSQDLSAIKKVSQEIGSALKGTSDYHVIVFRSTIEPGTTENVIKPILEEYSGKKCGEGFGLGFQPEFLREGSSIKDYDNPPFTIVGADSERSSDAVKEIFKDLPCEYITTTIGTAEMMKYACNTFHALKITFANEIGRISQALSVDSREVMQLVCKDKSLNISPAYLKPGFAYGGSCLPKDLRALLYSAKSKDVELPMLSGVMESNKVHMEHAINIVLSSGKKKIGMIGLSFKSGTDDLRESPLVIMAERFIGKGLDLQIYDPEVNIARLVGANKKYIEESIPHISSLMVDDCKKLVEHADVLIVGIIDKNIEELLSNSTSKEQLILDLVNLKNRKDLKGLYTGVCW